MTLYDKYQIFISIHIMFIFIYIYILTYYIIMYIYNTYIGWVPIFLGFSITHPVAGPGLLQATVQFKMLRYRIWRRDDAEALRGKFRGSTYAGCILYIRYRMGPPR